MSLTSEPVMCNSLNICFDNVNSVLAFTNAIGLLVSYVLLGCCVDQQSFSMPDSVNTGTEMVGMVR